MLTNVQFRVSMGSWKQAMGALAKIGNMANKSERADAPCMVESIHAQGSVLRIILTMLAELLAANWVQWFLRCFPVLTPVALEWVETSTMAYYSRLQRQNNQQWSTFK